VVVFEWQQQSDRLGEQNFWIGPAQKIIICIRCRVMDAPSDPTSAVDDELDSALIEEALQQACVPLDNNVDPEYAALVERARGRDWRAWDALQLVYVCGVDPLGQPIVVVVASRLPARKVDLDDLLLYFIHVLDPVVQQPYVLVYVASDITLANKPPFAWLKRAYSLFARKYKKHIQHLYVLHPTPLTRVVLKFFARLVR
jgi:hypothetical protein